MGVKLRYLIFLGWLCVPLSSFGQEVLSSNSDVETTQVALNDEDFQVGDDGYVSNKEEKLDTYFEEGYQQLAYQYAERRSATGHSHLIFNPQKLRWFAYDGNGNFVGSGRASGGRAYCHDTKKGCRTPVGTFTVKTMGGPACASSKYPLGRGGAPMPYCMFFHRGYAIHGSNDVPDYHASHGCVRVEPQAARWLRYNLLKIGSTVIVEPY